MSRTMENDRKSYETLAGNSCYEQLIERLTRDRANLLDEVVKAQAEIERLKKRNDTLDIRLGDANTEAERLKAEVKEGYELWVRVVNERDDASVDVKALRARVEELEVKALDKVWEVEKERDTLKARVEELEAEVKNKYSRGEMMCVVEERDKLCDKAKHLQDSYNSLWYQYRDACRDRHELRKVVAEYSDGQTELETQIETLEHSEDNLRTQLDNAIAASVELSKTCNELRTRLADQTKHIATLQDKYAALSETHGETCTRLAESAQELRESCYQHAGMVVTIDALNTRLASYEKAEPTSPASDEEVVALCKKLIAKYGLELDLLRDGPAIREPVLVKQTWQRVYSKATAALFLDSRPDTLHQQIGLLRRDHLSDGTVTCTLEPV